jgi:peptidoglycan hydrolase-like protein with peptidoglycan-binding domain
MKGKAMQSSGKRFWSTAILAVMIVLAAASPTSNALAQGTSAAPAAVGVSELGIKALQEALNRQGIAVTVDGILNDATRAAVRKYQSQHHLPVTGEADKATIDKLGVANRQSSTNSQVPAQATPPAVQGPGQAAPPPMQAGMQGGMMMNCPMMHGQALGQMQAMMQMMQGMMQMMQGQTQPGQMQPGQR